MGHGVFAMARFYLSHHLAVRAEVIETSGKQTVRAIDPIMQRRNDLARAIDIVVVAVDLDQARVGLDAVDVVVQLAVLVYNAILLFGIRFGIRFRIWIRCGRKLAIRTSSIDRSISLFNVCVFKVLRSTIR